jgi:hypothetical protein
LWADPDYHRTFFVLSRRYGPDRARDLLRGLGRRIRRHVRSRQATNSRTATASATRGEAKSGEQIAKTVKAKASKAKK